jgi:ribosomal protein S18 acetylase RimI-like enzyme
MEDDVRFRPARAGDLPAIVRLLADDPLGAKREDVRDPLPEAYRRAFAEIEADPNNEVLVAIRGGAVVGTLQLTFIPGLSHTGGRRCQIEAVRIDGAMRGSGLGRRLIEHAIERARERGCRLVQLTTDKTRADARRFYEGLGFTASHEGMKLRL